MNTPHTDRHPDDEAPPQRAGWPETVLIAIFLMIFALVAPKIGNPIGWFFQ